MLKKYCIKLIGIFLAVCFVLTVKNINFDTLNLLTNNTPITFSNIDKINSEHLLGDFIQTNITEDTWTTGGEKEKKTSLVVKLFGFIPIKKTKVVLCEDKNVYLGGIPLGFSVSTKGVIVVGTNASVSSNENSAVNVLQTGDILTKVNNESIFNVSGIQKQLKDSSGEPVDVTFLRNEKEHTGKLTPVFDLQSNEYKLGIWIKNDAQGIGTLTFVTKEKDFGALGHAITDYETGEIIPVSEGKIYSCSMLGITKGQKGKAGELRCLFVQGLNEKGIIEKNTSSGVFGELTNDEKIIDKNINCDIASRLTIKPGKAKLVSAVSGIREEYDIEIIKTYNQNSSQDKSFVFRVKDKRLLSLTGGIVQGMSGSPIIQDGKLVGAVTHVFLYDPTKGYGVYLDWMMQEVA